MHAAADSGCNETAQLMCERSNHGLCRLQRQSWHCGDARVMDVLLGLMHRWRWRGELYIPVCPSVGRNLSELSAGDLSQPDFSGVWMPPPRFERYTAKWRCQCGCRMLADSRGTYSIRFR
jgi:hypothetical protein